MNLFLEMTINMFPETILSEKFHLLLLEEITRAIITNCLQLLANHTPYHLFRMISIPQAC